MGPSKAQIAVLDTLSAKYFASPRHRRIGVIAARVRSRSRTPCFWTGPSVC